MRRMSWTLQHRGLQMHHGQQRTRNTVAMLPAYKSVSKERVGGWWLGWSSFASMIFAVPPCTDVEISKYQQVISTAQIH